MADVLEVLPIDSESPRYTVDIELSEQIYRFNINYNTRFDFWTLDILTTEDEPIVLGVKIVSNFPILAKYTDSRLPIEEIITIDVSGKDLNPTRDTLGDDVILIYVIPEAA